MFDTTRRLAVIALACTATLGFAQANKGEIRIAHIHSKTGPLEAYAKQTQAGLMMGLNYATGGNRSAAAKLLGISRASLYDRLSTLDGLSEIPASV